MERPYTKFYARLLGGYSLTFGKETIRLDINIKSKSMQIFLMLIKAGTAGCSRDELLQVIRDNDEGKIKRSNNLRQQIYLLRKAVSRANLPAGEYIVLKKSRYYFSLDYPVETDTGYLDQVLAAIRNGADKNEQQDRRGEEYEALLMNFCKHYSGEFLPMLSGEEWVTVESAYYQKWYFSCLNQLCEILKKQKKYETILELCTAASQMHPYDEWQVMQIDCLMSLHRYKEAQRVYKKASKLFYDELGVQPMDRMIAKYRTESGTVLYPANALSEIKDGLREPEEVQGAYECSYPSFLDIYHLVSRNGERSGVVSTLVIASLVKKEMEEIDLEEKKQKEQYFNQKMEMFRQIIKNNVRSGDIYTRYSKNQFLVLLTGAKTKDAQAVIQRIKMHWEEIRSDERPEACFTAFAVENSGTERCIDAEERDIYSACDQSGECYMAGAGNLAG